MTLPDYLRAGLDLVIVGINPGLRSEATGHHYAGPGNHFWPLLYESRLVSGPLAYQDDMRVLEWNIGLTNMVPRASAGVSDLSATELRVGAGLLRDKLRRVHPRVICFNGKAIFEVFAGRKTSLGLQPERFDGSLLFVMPSTSARTAAYQRQDKLRFFLDLKSLVERVRAGVEVAS